MFKDKVNALLALYRCTEIDQWRRNSHLRRHKALRYVLCQYYSNLGASTNSRYSGRNATDPPKILTDITYIFLTFPARHLWMPSMEPKSR